jgi:exosome complex RNA-binding protein Csl4
MYLRIFHFLFRDYESGEGTLVNDKKIFSSLYGNLNIIEKNAIKKLEVIHKNSSLTYSITPHINNIVLCKIKKITNKYAEAVILSVEDKLLSSPLPARIRFFLFFYLYVNFFFNLSFIRTHMKIEYEYEFEGSRMCGV